MATNLERDALGDGWQYIKRLLVRVCDFSSPYFIRMRSVMLCW